MFIPKFVTSVSIDSFRSGEEISLDKDETNHAAVLRVKPGDTVRLYSLTAHRWFEGTYTRNEGSAGVIALTRELSELKEAKSRVRLYVGTPSSAAMETIVQHTTEIGIAEIIMYRAERTQLKLDTAARDKISNRLYKISVAALKQCGASMLPRIELRLDSVVDAARAVNPKTIFVGSLQPQAGLLTVLTENRSVLSPVERSEKTADLISVIIGPEGGLTDTEERELFRIGVTPFSLGPAALRVETACIVTTGIVNAFIQSELNIDAVSQLQTSHLRPQG